VEGQGQGKLAHHAGLFQADVSTALSADIVSM